MMEYEVNEITCKRCHVRIRNAASTSLLAAILSHDRECERDGRVLNERGFIQESQSALNNVVTEVSEVKPSPLHCVRIKQESEDIAVKREREDVMMKTETEDIAVETKREDVEDVMMKTEMENVLNTMMKTEKEDVKDVIMKRDAEVLNTVVKKEREENAAQCVLLDIVTVGSSQTTKNQRKRERRLAIIDKTETLRSKVLTYSERTELMHKLTADESREYFKFTSLPLLVPTASYKFRCQLCQITLPTHHSAVRHVNLEPKHRQLMKDFKSGSKFMRIGHNVYWCETCRRQIQGGLKMIIYHNQEKSHHESLGMQNEEQSSAVENTMVKTKTADVIDRDEERENAAVMSHCNGIVNVNDRIMKKQCRKNQLEQRKKSDEHLWLMHECTAAASRLYFLLEAEPLLIHTVKNKIRCQLCEVTLLTPLNAVHHVHKDLKHRQLMTELKSRKLKAMKQQTGRNGYWCDICNRNIKGSLKNACEHLYGKRHRKLLKKTSVMTTEKMTNETACGIQTSSVISD